MNSHYPRFSPDGSLIACGAGEVFLRDAVHGVTIRSLGYGHQPSWFTPSQVLVKGKDSHDDRPYLLDVITGARGAPLSDHVAAAYTAGGGQWFATDGARIAVAVSRQGQRAWVIEHHGDNNDHSLYLERMVGQGAGRRLEPVAVIEHQSVHRPRVEDGYLVWTFYPGDRQPQEIWGLRPDRTTPERLRTVSEGWEDGAVPILTPEGPWLLFLTNTDLRARPWDSFDGHIIPTGENQNFNPDAIAIARELRFAWNTEHGAIPPQQAAISLDEPRVDTRLGSVVPRSGRPVLFGWFEFAPAPIALPCNCRLPIRRTRPWETLELSDGTPRAVFIAGDPEGDPDAIVRAVALARAGQPLPVLAYVPRGVRSPANADILGLEAYQGTDETERAFEARLRTACASEHPRPVILFAQCYTSNARHVTELRHIPAVIARVAIDHPNVVGALVFSAWGRDTGLQDHPEALPYWQQFGAGVPGVPTEVGALLKTPAVSVDRWTLDELRDGREIIFHDRENPAPGYRFRVFVRDGSLFAEIANASGVGVTGARRPVKPSPAPAPLPTPPPPPGPAPSTPEAICRLIWREELEREIDPSGLASCVQALEAGQLADAIRAGVRQSDEYRELQERKRHTPR